MRRRNSSSVPLSVQSSGLPQAFLGMPDRRSPSAWRSSHPHPLSHRYGSRRDFQDLSRLSVSDFRQRARCEINLSSSPTLKLTSDEVKQKTGGRREGGGHQRQRSLVSRTLIGASEGPDEMENIITAAYPVHETTGLAGPTASSPLGRVSSTVTPNA